MTLTLSFAATLLMASLANSCFAGTDAAKGLYDRISDELRSRPELADLGKPPPELAKVAWMAGEWDIETRVSATTGQPERVDRGSSSVIPVLGGTWLQFTDTYPNGGHDLSYPQRFDRGRTLPSRRSLSRSTMSVRCVVSSACVPARMPSIVFSPCEMI